MIVVRAFGGAEDGCAASEVRAQVEADEAGGPCTVCLTGTALAAGALPLRLAPELVPVARRLLSEGVAAFAGLVATCRDGGAQLLAAAGELQLWVRHTDDRQRVIALAHRAGADGAMVATAHDADLFIALGRVERYLRQAGILPPLPQAA
jgi:hypothetical protein